MLIFIASVPLSYIQQQSFLTALRHGETEPVGVIPRRDVKRLCDLLIERRSAVPNVIVLNRFRRNQLYRSRANLLAGAVIKFDIVKALIAKLPI